MRTLLPDPPPLEFEALLERRRATGVDLYDEVWEGVLHVNPGPAAMHGLLQARMLELLRGHAADGLVAIGPFNVGVKDDFRVPDGGLVVFSTEGLYLPTAALVLEVVSPRDETWEKLPFYAAHGVEEVLIVDAAQREVTWLGLEGGRYGDLAESAALDIEPGALAGLLGWG